MTFKLHVKNQNGDPLLTIHVRIKKLPGGKVQSSIQVTHVLTCMYVALHPLHMTTICNSAVQYLDTLLCSGKRAFLIAQAESKFLPIDPHGEY